jgi:hypothetical protein
MVNAAPRALSSDRIVSCGGEIVLATDKSFDLSKDRIDRLSHMTHPPIFRAQTDISATQRFFEGVKGVGPVGCYDSA